MNPEEFIYRFEQALQNAKVVSRTFDEHSYRVTLVTDTLQRMALAIPTFAILDGGSASPEYFAFKVKSIIEGKDASINTQIKSVDNRK